jgi:hypothetical protein
VSSLDPLSQRGLAEQYGNGKYFELWTGVSRLYRKNNDLVVDIDLDALLEINGFSVTNCVVIDESYRTAEYGNAWAYIRCIE